MSTLKVPLNKKQKYTVGLLEDDIHSDVLYGGGAGSGKSFLGCCWQLIRRVSLPETRGFIARKQLADIKKSTLVTFFQVAGKLGLSDEFELRVQENQLKFRNGSVIQLLEANREPGDPEYERLGSQEYTDGFTDEVTQLEEKAVTILNTRLRYLHNEYGLRPKHLQTCNPAKNWVKRKYYIPWSKGELQSPYAFVQALVTDNPKTPESYIETLKRSDKATVERLLHGNWDYDADPTSLIDDSAAMDVLTNVVPVPGEKYTTVDVATPGTKNDGTCICSWSGMRVEVTLRNDLDTTGIVNTMAAIGNPRSRESVDNIGVGRGVYDLRKGCQQFIANATPYNPIYKSLRDEAFYWLAEQVNDGNICIVIDEEHVDRLKAELSVIKTWKADTDGKLQVLPKEKMKELLGYSPDIIDALSQRVLFDKRKKPQVW